MIYTCIYVREIFSFFKKNFFSENGRLHHTILGWITPPPLLEKPVTR